MRSYKILEKPLIFIGNPRSGTSVISEIVMRHKDLGFPSQHQNRFLEKTSINYLRRLFDNSLWRVHGQKKQLNKVNFINKFTFRTWENYAMWDSIVEKGVDFGRDFLVATRASEESIDYLRGFFARIVRKQGKKRLAFKITGPSRIEYLSSVFPDAQFVRIQRKPVPTISSLLKVPFWQKNSQGRLWWSGPYSEEELQWVAAHNSDPVALAAFQLKKIEDTTEAEIQKVGADILTITYGDFVSDPKGVVSEILRFAGLSMDKACFDYFKKNSIYQQNKRDGEYFEEKDLKTIYGIFDRNADLKKTNKI